MSRTIDERVVSMQFDNRQFESNVRTSLGTIERLKQSLDFKSASNGLNNVTKAAKSCNLAPLSSAAETVRMKFSAMEVMAVTALANITNSAINTGKKIVSALTIDPIKTGLSEYETQIGAIQTILANTESKGTTLDDVNAALDELNTYADKTIYNFTQMTRNIGTFTAAGVGLDESTQAIKGIANLAAVSGSTSQQASTAMYQLSQALAAGRVSLMDWNSVVNAGMGGEVFQNALKRTSRMLGTGVDEAIKKYGTFRESLTQGQWLTKEVLVETLAQLSGAYDKADLIAQGFTEQQANEIVKLADTAEQAATKVKTFTQLWDTLKESAQSGWTQTWEYVLGDFEESKWFFSNLSDTIGAFIGKGAESRNNLLGEALTSNYDKLIGKLGEAGIEATDFEAKVKEVLKTHCYDVDYLIEKYGSLGRAFTHGAIPTATLKEALNGLGQAADISLEGIDRVLKKGTSGEDVKKAQQALKALGHDLGTFGEKADGVDGILGGVTESAIKAFQAAHDLEATGIIDEKTLEALEKAANSTKVLGKELYGLIDDVDKLGGGELLRESISNVVTGVLNILSTVRSAWAEVFKIEPDQIYNALDVIHNLTGKFVKWTENNADKIKMVFQGVFSVVGVAWDTLQAVFAGVWKIASPIFSTLAKGVFTAASALSDWLIGLRESLIESGKFAEITESVAGAISKVIDYVKTLGKPIWEWVFGSENDAEGQLTGLQQFIEKIKNFISESEALAHVGATFSNFGKKIRDYFTNLFPSKEELEQKVFNIKGVLTKVGEDIVNFFKNFSAKDIVDKIRNFFREFGDKFNTDLLRIGFDFSAIKSSIEAKFVVIRDAIVNFFKNFSFEEASAKLKENFAKIGPIISSCFEKIVEMFGVSKQKLEEIREKITGFFGGIFGFLGENKGAIAALGTILGIIAVLAKIKDAIERIAGIFDAFDNIKEAFEGLIESKKALNKAAAGKIRTESVRNIAIAIGILAGSLWVISKIPKDDLLRAGVTLAIITGAVIGLMFLVKFINTNITVKSIAGVISFGTLMASLGAALILMTLAVKILGKMDPGELKQGGLAVAAFVGLTVLLMKASKSINKGEFASFGKMMRQLGTALLILSASVYIFGKMDRGTLIQGGLAVTYFLGLMAGVMAIAGLLEGDVASFGKMIRNLSVSLLLLAGVVYIFGNMDTKTLIQGGLAVTTFLGIMLIAMALSRKATKDVASFGSMMLGIGASLVLMALAVKMLGDMDTGALVKGMIFIAGFAGIIIGLMAATKLMGKYSFNAGKMGLMSLSFSTSLLIMAGAVTALSMIDGNDLTKALAAIAGIGLIFSGLLAVTKYAKNTQVGTILALAGAVAVIAGAVAALSFIPKEKLINATACLGILAGMFSLLSYTSKFASGKSLLSLAGMALVIGGIGLIFVKLSDIVTDADKAVKVATAVGILVTALSISSLALSKIGGTGTNTKAIFTGLGVFAGLATIVTIFAGIAIASLPAIARKLSGFMTELEPFISGMTKIDRSMVTNIKILGEAMSAFAGAGAKFAFANMFTLGGATMAFGEFVNFISQVVPVIKDAAIDTAGVDIDFTNLNAIINAIGGLAEAAALVPTNTIAFAAGKWGVGAFINVNDLTAFTTFVTSVIPLMQEFAIAIKGADIDTSSTAVISDLFEAIGSLAEAADKAPGIEAAAGLAKFKGGVAGGGYVSVPDLHAFTSYVKGIFKALEDFLPEISGTVPTIPIEFITGIFNGIKTLGEAAAAAPTVSAGVGFAKFGKLYGVFGGSTWTDMDEFRKYLVGDGNSKGAIDAIKEFVNGIDYASLKDIDADKIEPIMTGITNVITAISELGKAADAAPKSSVGGGVGGAFSKLGKALGIGAGGYKSTTDLVAFKDYLLGDNGAIAAVKSFIDGMAPIAGQLDDYKPEKITAITDGISNVISAISALAAAASSAPTNIDAHGIGGFGGFLKGFVGGFGKADLVTTTDLDSFKSWLIGSDGKSGMMGALTGFIDIFEDKATLNAIKKIADNTKGIDTVISAVTSLAGLANSAPKQIDAKGGFGGIFSKLVGGLGIGAGGGYGEYHSVTDLKNFKDWITEVTPVIKGFVVDVSGVEIPDTSALETVLTAVDTIATAASNIQPKTEGWAAGLAVISGIPVLAGGSGGSAADYQGFISLMENLGSSDGPLATLITTVNGLTFDGSVDSAASQKLTCLLQAVDALATASANIPEYTVFESGLAIIAGYKKAPDFTGFTNWINGMIGEDGKGGIVKLISDANTNLPGEGELDPAKITNLCYVVKELADAASVLPDTSVWGELFSGTTNFDGFATFVETIGSEVTTFAETIADSTIEDIDLNKILSLADVLKTIAEVGNLIGNSSYVDVSVLGLEDGDGKSPIDYIVDAVVSAKEALGKLEESDLAALEVAGNTITAFSQTLTNVAGNYASLAQYTPENNEQFKTFVTDLATSLSDFTANMEGVNLDRLSIASNAVSLIAGTLTKLAALEYGSINTALLKQKLDELATAMNDFTTNFNADSISTSISTVSTLATDLSTALSKDFSGAEKFKSALDTLGSANTDLSGLSGLGDKLSSTASSSVDAFVSAFSSSSSKLSTVGTGMTQQLVSGISSGAKSVASAAKAIADAAALAVSGKYSAFYNAGGSVAQGFANGISSNQYLAVAKARAMADAAYQAAKQALNVNSPSKLFRSLGYTVPEGFAIGIDRMGGLVKESSKAMADTAFEGTKSTIARLAESINTDIDAQPTIRPVLDLSDVQSGASQIGTMFGTNPSIGVLSRVGTINSMMNARVQNGANSDVISAINDLGKKLGSNGGDTYNVKGVT